MTKYAKIANIEFNSAAELVTATTNSMGVDVEKVIDVFLTLGDSAATSGEEIGKGMQKAAAAAATFGMDFEWLATDIAVVSETLRTAPESIGNAFNTMMARMHSIKQNGFNSEDATRINDVAKALNVVGMELMDQNGKWMEMDDIFIGIADKWGTLDDKQKSYIATTMAGTRQQNVFFALMNDMSKGIEGGSRAWELYEKAVNAAGTATEKFGVWQESVAASQNRMNESFEELYANMEPNIIKGFYDGMADIITMLARGTDVLDGWNIKLPLITAGVTALVIVLRNAGGILAAMSSHPLIAAVTAFIAIGGTLTAIASNVETASMRFDDATEKIQDANNKIEETKTLQKEMQQVFSYASSDVEMTRTQMTEYNTVLDKLAQISPVAKKAVEDLKNGMLDQADAAKILNGELDKVVKQEEGVSHFNAAVAYQNMQTPDQLKGYYKEDFSIKEFYNELAAFGDMGTNPAETLKKFYETYESMLYAGPSDSDFDPNFYTDIKKRIYHAIEGAMTSAGSDNWDLISQGVWQELLGSENALSEMESVASTWVKELIGYFVGALTDIKNDAEAKTLQQQLYELFIGDDGAISIDKVLDAHNVLDNADLTIDRRKYALNLFDQIFGKGDRPFIMESDYDAVTQYIESMIAFGISNVDMSRVLNKSIGQLPIDAVLSELTEGIFSLADFDRMDEDAKKTTYDLMNAGVAVEDLRLAFAESKSLDEYKAKLDEIRKTLSNTGDAAGDTGEDIEAAAPNINTLVAEIERAEKAIKNLNAGKPADTSDLKTLVEAHPELMLIIGDTKELSSALQTIANQDRKAVVSAWAEMAKGAEGSVEAFKRSVSEMPESWAAVLENAKTLSDVTEANSAEAPGLLEAIIKYAEEAAATLLDATKQGEELAQVMSASDAITKLQSEITKIEGMVKGIDNGELSLTDIMELAKTHKDLLDVVGDADALKAKLKEIAKEDEAKVGERWGDFVREQQQSAAGFGEWLKKNHWVYATDNEELIASVETVEELRALLITDGKYPQTFLDYIDEYINSFNVDAQAAITTIRQLKQEAQTKAAFRYDRDPNGGDSAWSRYLGSATQDQLGEYMRNAFQVGNVDLLNRPTVRGGDGTYATVESTSFTAGKTDEWGNQYDKNIVVSLTPILPNGQRLTDDALEEYFNELLQHDDILEADKIENGGKGLLLNMMEGDGSAEDAIATMEEWEERLHELQEAYYSGSAGLGAMAQQIQDTFEIGRSSVDGFKNELDSLMAAAQTGDQNELMEVWSGLGTKMQEAIADKYPRLVTALNKVNNAAEDSTEEFEELRKEIGSAVFTSSAKHFQNTAKAIDQLKNYEINAADAMAAFNKEAELAAKAQAEFKAANTNFANGVEVASEDVKNLANFLGYINPDVMLDNWDQVGPMISNALAEGEDAFRRLNEAAFIEIVGTSVSDFSELENGLIDVQNMAQETIDLLIATGQWELVTEDLPQEMPVFAKDKDGIIKQIGTNKTVGHQSYLKATGDNPFKSIGSHAKTSAKKSSSGGGGGGGSRKKSNDNTNNTSSSSSNQISEVERMLDIMDQIQKFQNHTKDIYSAMAKYYEGTGELQGVIAYYELEKQAIADINATLEANVKDIEAQMHAKQAEVAAMDTSSEAYKDAADDLEKLQSKHQDYTKQIINNKAELDSLTKAIKKQQDAIRQMEIDLRNTIYKAIEDREALIERKLQGRIALEDEILDLIQKRYEKERDMILENSQAQIDALEQEKDLLSEQLQLRREQAEEEDKRAKLAELEAQYARISADPTRAKEALKIQNQIKDLREEMAWDLAEKEVEAQQKSLDDQITSIEDYMDYVTKYYEDLFEHPKKLIEEMQSIITQTDDYIMNWLKQNSEEYANVTIARQQDMANNWEQMLLDMHGALKLYWDEVENIISQGDDAIINFLINNSADFKKAGALQAQAYVDQWTEQLKNLALAHKQVTAQLVQNTYDVIKPYTGSGSDNSSDTSNSSSSKGGSSGRSGTTGSGTKYGYKAFAAGETRTSGKVYNTKEEAVAAGTAWADDYIRQFLQKNVLMPEAAKASLYKQKSVAAFLRGGLADFTGPAWLDGSKTNPERVLSPVQTELFERLVQSLESMATVRVSSLPAFGDVATGATATNVGDIIVNVDRLDSDADYEEMAERVFETIMDRINRGAVVGGIRY